MHLIALGFNHRPIHLQILQQWVAQFTQLIIHYL
jgi:hypothetical protein